jgi:hypothetical protein
VALVTGCESVKPLSAAQRAQIRTVGVAVRVEKAGSFENPVGGNTNAFHDLQHGGAVAELDRAVGAQAIPVNYDELLQTAGIRVDELVRSEFLETLRQRRPFGAATLATSEAAVRAADARFELKLLGYGFSAASSLQWRVRPFVSIEARLIARDGTLLARGTGDGYDVNRPTQTPEAYLADASMLGADLATAARIAAERLLKEMLP